MAGGTIPTGTILDQIVADVASALEKAKKERSIPQLEDLAAEHDGHVSLYQAVLEGPQLPCIGGTDHSVNCRSEEGLSF